MENRKLHIVIFGNERSIHVRRWVLGLRDLGHRVDLISLRKSYEDNIGGHSLNAKSKLSYLLKINLLRKNVAELKPDIFHAHYASSYGFLSSFIVHPRKILSVWGDDIILFPHKSPINRWMSFKALAGHDRITATSEYLGETLIKFNLQLPPVSIIPFGVDTQIFKHHERNNRPDIRIGIAKHLDSLYGVDTLIRSFHKIKQRYSNAYLFIGGTGPMENKYKHLVSRLGLDAQIKFVGQIRHCDMPQFYNSIDIAAMPSRSEAESFGVAAIEAAATGLPVVGTNIGGIPEVIQHGVTGYLAGVDNIDQIAEYLIRLIKDPDLRKQMGLAGRKMVQDKYEWTNNLIEMQELYYKMVKS